MMNKCPTTKVRVQVTSFEGLIEDSEREDRAEFHQLPNALIDNTQAEKIENSINESAILDRLSPQKREIAQKIMDGGNWHSVANDMGLKSSQMYRIKGELREELGHLKQKDMSVQTSPIDGLLRASVGSVTMSDFIKYWLADYDSTNEISYVLRDKELDKVTTAWKFPGNQYSYIANPRVRDVAIIAQAVKSLILRTHKKHIVIFYGDTKIMRWAWGKFRKIIRLSPYIADNFNLLHGYFGNRIMLGDGSSLTLVSNELYKEPIDEAYISVLKNWQGVYQSSRRVAKKVVVLLDNDKLPSVVMS